jgi:hypothetical protein
MKTTTKTAEASSNAVYSQYGFKGMIPSAEILTYYTYTSLSPSLGDSGPEDCG